MGNELVFGCHIIDPRAVTAPKELAAEYDGDGFDLEPDWDNMTYQERRATKADYEAGFREDE